MITLTINLNGHSKALEALLRKEIEPVMQAFNSNANIRIDVKDGGSVIFGTNVTEEDLKKVAGIADMCFIAYQG